MALMPVLPSLNALRCFEVAGRLESFSRAGDELHLTHGAVSRQIKLLEEDLGVRLFERRNRRVFLTDPGRSLLTVVSEALSRIQQATARLRHDPSAPLVLSCEPTRAQRWLIPKMPDLQRQLPGVVLHILAAGGPVHFERDRVDLAIRRNDFSWAPRTYAELIMSEEVGPVCSPKF